MPTLRRPLLSPHILIAVLVGIDGLLLVASVLLRVPGSLLIDLFVRGDLSALARIEASHLPRLLFGLNAIERIDFSHLPRALAGLSLIALACGLVIRARTAWAFTLVMLVLAAAINFHLNIRFDLTFALSLACIALLLWYWREFDRASFAAATLYTLVAVFALLVYATFGTMYLGHEFAPPVTDLATAFYFAIVTMTTVGYGDIVPHSIDARLFTASVIVFGISVFATSLTVVIGPLVGGNLKKILSGRFTHVIRKNHFIVAGASPLAINVHHELTKRGWPVTVIIASGSDNPYPEEADVMHGDASDNTVLTHAGIEHAKAVLALRADDSENAFIVLAAKEIAPTVRTIASVNDSKHLSKLKRVQPDMIFAPPVVGGELLARTLSGETVDNETVMRLLFHGDT
ncbi:voltage-gated potassium channel protein [Pandoraea cepalis]|uniref:Voltage-gated potassium channel protein n=1 Tax=Pandoraea cepalis TaxID=2508294 RepID=A0AAW7MQW9_9BURK|nr:voltage-gated potassium channel protein [Pandoraea cepalis]MDN4579246.1 voltage-gated potassium channel protein [Pandoraea cepalis]